MRPIWDFLPEAWRETLSEFWNSKIYPNIIAPVLSRLPEKVRKFLLFGIRRAAGTTAADGQKGAMCCAADGTCGFVAEGGVTEGGVAEGGVAEGESDANGNSVAEEERSEDLEERNPNLTDANFTDAKPSDEDSTTCEERSASGASGAMRLRRKKIPDGVVAVETTEKFEEVLSLAGSLPKCPVFLDFTASWCKPCQTIKPVFSALADQHQGKAIFCVVDVEEAEELAERFGIVSLPTIVCVDATGEEAERLKLVTEGTLKDFVAKAC